MYVEKIEIPAFRVLRDVVLEFGEVYEPQIFPIGSENGGGKSTLLQLVFALLHCSANRSRRAYLENLLASDLQDDEEDIRLIARLTVRLDGESYALEFLSLHAHFLGRLDDPPRYGFETWARADAAIGSKTRLTAQLDQVLFGSGSTSEEAARLKEEIADKGRAATALETDLERINGFLIALNYKFITTYQCQTPRGQDTRAFICHIQGQSTSKTETSPRVSSSA